MWKTLFSSPSKRYVVCADDDDDVFKFSMGAIKAVCVTQVHGIGD